MSDPLWQPGNPCGNGLDPPNIKISDSGGLDPKAWCLDVWMLKDWNKLKEVTEVTAFWEEGTGRNSHTLKLQELGGSDDIVRVSHALRCIACDQIFVEEKDYRMSSHRRASKITNAFT